MLVLISTTAFATIGSRTAELLYDNIKVMLNGKEITPTDANGNVVEPFIINGTTYLPVRGVASALGLNVGWDAATNTVTLNEPGVNFVAGNVSERVQVINEYVWDEYSYKYIGIVVKNTSNSVLEARIQLKLLDADGNTVGAKSSNIEAFGPGSEALFIFSNEEKFAKYEYNISSSEDEYYVDVVSTLSKKVSTTNNKAIIEIQNNGNIAAEFVEYNVLFLKNGNVVDHGYGYCVDDDSEIKPGSVEFAEETTFETFDEVKIYLTGRGSK